MRYEVTHGQDNFRVEIVEISPDTYEVRLDDQAPVRVDACKEARTIYSLLIESRQYEGSVDWSDDGALHVHLGTSAFEFTAIDERRKLLVSGIEPPAAGKQELLAQMPGKIVKVLVELGQQVELDEGLIVIEAMKMENELRSPIQGTVTQIEVGEGDAVETGTLLIVVDPGPGEE